MDIEHLEFMEINERNIEEIEFQVSEIAFNKLLIKSS